MGNIQNMGRCVNIPLAHTFGFVFFLFSCEVDNGHCNMLLSPEENEYYVFFKKIVLCNQNLPKTFF
jgi:hypothetical protein